MTCRDWRTHLSDDIDGGVEKLNRSISFGQQALPSRITRKDVDTDLDDGENRTMKAERSVGS